MHLKLQVSSQVALDVSASTRAEPCELPLFGCSGCCWGGPCLIWSWLWLWPSSCAIRSSACPRVQPRRIDNNQLALNTYFIGLIELFSRHNSLEIAARQLSKARLESALNGHWTGLSSDDDDPQAAAE